jgi:WD40 repeat protein
MRGASIAVIALFQLPYTAFQHPERVTVASYPGDAMEPFLTHDGRFLLFNNRNDPGVDTNLHYAARIDALHFAYRGEIQGVNTSALEAVPSVSCAGDLYFVSTRSYPETFSTIYRARFAEGVAQGVGLVPGISRRTPGWVNFDAEVSADGQTLYAVDSLFSAAGTPRSANLFMARKRNDGTFERAGDSGDLLRLVNTNELEYAPAVSSDGLELFFTRVQIRADAQPRIWRSVRRGVREPFAAPQVVGVISGFAEAPALSPDGLSLYYHARIDGRFVIFRVTREPHAGDVHTNGCPQPTRTP